METSSNRLGSMPGTWVLARLRHLLPLLIAFSAGGLLVGGFAPYSFWPIAPIAIALLIATLHRGSTRVGFWYGYAFGLGLLGFGVAWSRISLNEFGNMDGWLADLLMLVFVAVMALYYGLFGWLVRRLDRGPDWSMPVLLLPGLYLLLEWLRGWLFTGFPWLNLGYTQIDGPMAGLAPVIGVYGLTLLVAISGGLLWGLVQWHGRARVIAGALLLVIAVTGEALDRVEWTNPVGKPIQASVLQANIPQSVKWDPDALVSTIESYLELTRRHLDSDLILWPETAIPDYLHRVRAGLIDPLAQRAREEGTEVVIGIPVLDQDEGRIENGLIAIGSDEHLYAKRHLVPFGEFMPFKSWLGPLAHAFEVPMSDFSPGNAARPVLQVGPYRAGVSICYEDAFPGELIQALPEAQLLINVSNDAWFGDSLAPHQHLEIARMRSLETGRAMIRATNTGISAILDHHGSILGEIPHDVHGAYTDLVQPRVGATPFVQAGNWPAVGAAAALVAISLLLGLRPRAH